MKTTIKNSSCWRRRANLERCLIQLSALLLLLTTNQMAKGFVITTPVNNDLGLHGPIKMGIQNRATEDNTINGIPANCKPKDICLSAECIHTASAVLRKMNTDVEPCDDFYQFACGNYIDETQIPEDKVAVDAFYEIEDRLQEQLKHIIAVERAETDPKHLKLPNRLYKACMNKTLIESLGTKPIKKISDFLGGWPVIVGSSWDRGNTWTWQETIKKFRRLGFSIDYLVDFSIVVDLKDNTKRIIELDQPTTGLRREYLIKGFNEPLVSSYYDYMVDMAVHYGAKKEAAKIELKKSVQFEIELANIFWSNEKRGNSNDVYNLRTIKQLQESYNYVQWEDYINALLPEPLKVDENEVINLMVPSYFDDLGKLLNRTDRLTVANYLMGRIHAFSVDFMPKELRERQLQYVSDFSGRKEQKARWKECIDIVSGSCHTDEEILGLSISMGSLYVRKHFKQDSKAIALGMVKNIRDAFSQILDKVDWMDQQTREEAKRKLHAMTIHIGYPDEMLDNDKLEEYYRNLEIDEDKYFESFLKMNVVGTDYSFSRLRLPVNNTEWIRHARATVVDSSYSLTENSIQFPAGILQGHFFNAQRPQYMNYGAIGYVIGHELIHGFDAQGRQFDFKGNLIDWWQSETQQAYLEKVKCIIEQYGNYTDKQTGLNLNGIKTQGENIADNGGIKGSYLAYNQWVSKNGKESSLPGLNYTPNQMFWISAAQTWCAKYRTEFVKMGIITGVYSPYEFRVLGSLSNMKDFSRDFQCPEGTPMNPVQKCEVW